MEKVTSKLIFSLKGKRKITAITAYDYPSAFYADRAGVDIILVGDSLGMIIKGEKNTLKVSVEEIEYHVKAVSKGAKRSLIIADFPFLSYSSVEEALRNSKKFIMAGADAVKLEGSRPEQIRAIVKEGVPVMGHIGLTPQQYLKIGFKKQGREASSALRLFKEALIIQEAGAFSIVLESIPMEVAKEITSRLSIPTIGIGAGTFCDGQILVFHDLLGMYPGITPSFVRRYGELGKLMEKGVRNYIEDVISGSFPGEEESFRMKDEEFQEFLGEVKNGNF